ncbi:MAG: S9 family peptidase [Variovorax sp.]|nr:S9 family peptidase [Variovorax sp.]
MKARSLFEKWATMFVACLAFTALRAVAAVPPIEDFTRHPAIDSATISPSGKRLALLMFAPSGLRRAVVMNLDPVGEGRVVAEYGDADVTSVRWIGDDRLVYEAFKRGAEVDDGGAGTFAVDHDGGAQRQLIAWRRSIGEIPGTRIVARILPYGWSVRSSIDDGSNDVFVYRNVRDSVGDLKNVELARLSTTNGTLRTLSEGMPEGTRRWLLDPQREPRMVDAYRGGREHLYWRKTAGAAWDEVADFDPLGDADFSPWFIGDKNEVYVSATSANGTDALYRFDPVAKRVEADPVIGVTGFDLDAGRVVDTQTGRLVGVHFTTDRPTSYWFDEALQKIQNGVDAALPKGRSNRIACSRCESTRFFLIHSSSDRQPGEYFLFDRKKASLEFVGASRPWINEATQGTRTFDRIKARDGLEVPVYVTHPPGAAVDQALPAIMLVHGGPYMRGSNLQWEVEAQFFASRGYRVLQPEFRGTVGYGQRLFKAGWKEWGRAMQDDLADTVKWAADRHLIDPARVCIVGASYGGYAALMGPISTPGVYRCAASFAGVTDIDLMYSIHWSDFSEDSRRYWMPVMLGDRKTDAARLAAASPLKRVAEIKIPVLLAHGGVDRRVPIEHARKFASAAKDAHVPLEQVEYLEEGHGFFDPANHTDYYQRLEKFLEKALLGMQ